jgi:hypothetical protein
MVSDKKIFMGIKFGCGSHLGRRSEMSDTILEGDHPRIISAKFACHHGHNNTLTKVSSKNVSGGSALRPRWLHS